MPATVSSFLIISIVFLVCFDDAKVGHNSYYAKNIPARCMKLWGMCMK